MLRVFLKLSAICKFNVFGCPPLCVLGEETLRVAVSTRFAIIVFDIGLPNTNGYELLKRLRRGDLPARRVGVGFDRLRRTAGR